MYFDFCENIIMPISCKNSMQEKFWKQSVIFDKMKIRKSKIEFNKIRISKYLKN